MNKRHRFIDLYRGWAVIIMVETHAFNAWMDASFRDTNWFSYINFINGFVAPSFLFVSGISFALGVHLKGDSLSHWTPAVFKQFSKLFVIMGIGYLLHIPRLNLEGGFPFVRTEDLAEFFLADVLQTIALSLIILQILFLIVRSVKVFRIVVTLLTLAALFGTPYLWSIDFSIYLHPVLSNFLNGMHNPLFPLFPWCVFTWAGVLAGLMYFQKTELDGGTGIVQRIVNVGVFVFVLAYLADRTPITLFSYDNFWLTSPNWVLMRMGILMVLFGFFWFIDHREWHTSKFVLFIGGQSLFIYIAHLTMIYTVTGTKAAFPLLKSDFSPWIASLLFMFLLFSVYGLTKLWVTIKDGRRET